jgi:hypothetical protein
MSAGLKADTGFQIYQPIRSSKGVHLALLHRAPDHLSMQVIRLERGKIVLQSKGSQRLEDFHLNPERLNEQKGFVDFVVARIDKDFLLYAIKEDFSLWGMDLSGSWLPSSGWLRRLSNVSGRLYQFTRIHRIPEFLIDHQWRDENLTVFRFADYFGAAPVTCGDHFGL